MPVAVEEEIVVVEESSAEADRAFVAILLGDCLYELKRLTQMRNAESGPPDSESVYFEWQIIPSRGGGAATFGKAPMALPAGKFSRGGETSEMIELIDVHKTLSGKKVLDGLNLAVERGETFVIIGRSGTGKSVTIKHIVGIMTPDSGRVVVEGVEVPDLKKRELLAFRKKFGYLFQSNALLNSMTVFENIALPLREHEKMTQMEMESRVREKLSLVEMDGTQHLYPASLSGGMKKRVALARAIVRNPEVILYDEPTTGLDPITSASINIMIRDMQKKLHVTSIVVTHDINSAYIVGDRIGLLHAGKLLQVGTPDEIKNSQNLRVKQFIQGIAEGPLTA